MLLSDIDSWNVGALGSIAFELGDELTTIEGVASDLELISRLPGWDSPAADAARGKIGETTSKVLDDAAVIGAVQQLAGKPPPRSRNSKTNSPAFVRTLRPRADCWCSPTAARSRSTRSQICTTSCGRSPTTSKRARRR